MSKDKVAYKPLGTSPPVCDGDNDDDEQDEAECEVELERPFSRLSSSHQYKHQVIFSNTLGRFDLRHLRTLLYLVAILLFLIFIAQIFTNDRSRPSANIRSTFPHPYPLTNHQHHQLDASRKQTNSLDTATNVSREESSPTNNNVPTISNTLNSGQFAPDTRPQYDSYLSSVLHDRDSQVHGADGSNREPFDDLHFPIDDHRHHNQSSSSNPPPSAGIWWLLGLRDTGKYVTVTDYIRAMKSFSYNNSITLTTQATTEFMYHTLELCKRWDGPISVAVFSPGPEILVATTLIKYMRQCLPGPLSACIKDKVTWHLVYNKSHGPKPNGTIRYPRFHLDSENHPLFVNQDQCPKFAGPSPSETIKQFEEELRKGNKLYPDTYRQKFKLTYPINVLRNTARLAASTRYVLASDIELYPSINLVPSFTNYINKHDIRKEYNYIKNFDLTLPIFEVKSNITAPKTKRELIKLVEQGDAIFFHKWVCDACQNFPNRMDWLQTDKYGYDDYHASDNEIVIFEVTQRNKTRDSWEPIFIGTNDDPLYDDRLTWDGRRDKMAQMYEMCLKDYYLLVVGNAFLVHAPGIKHIDKNDNMKRLKYMRENNAIYDATMAKLRQQYANSSNINKC